MATIFHLALAADWAAARETGAYTVSTRGRTLAEEGFIHASRADQWPAVRAAFYGDVAAADLVLLQVDTDRLEVPVVDEPPTPGATETFPHIYGPLPVSAVVRALPLPERERGAPGVRPRESFSRLYLREMSFNAAIGILAILVSIAGMVLGGLAGDDKAPAVGGLVGLVVGIAVAAGLYRRRHSGVRQPSRASSS